jgi:hypothetical protein
LVEWQELLEMYQNLAMDRRNRVDHQRSDQMDRRKDDNDELERMPLLYRSSVERV